MGISWQELILLLVIVLVLFGPKRLPEVGRSLGHGLREFKDSMAGIVSGDDKTPDTTKAAVAVPVEVTPVSTETTDDASK